MIVNNSLLIFNRVQFFMRFWVDTTLQFRCEIKGEPSNNCDNNYKAHIFSTKIIKIKDRF